MRRSITQSCPGTGRLRGMTLVELIIVITISGIVATMLAMFIVRPMEGYQAQVRRAALVDAAESALQRMTRDIHRALPNSVRVDATGQIIEMLDTLDGARYRAGPGVLGTNNHTTSASWLTIGAADSSFNILGRFRVIEAQYGGLPPAAASAGWRLAIYNLGVPTADAYADAGGAGARVITDAGINISLDQDEWRITPVAGSFRFHWASPYQRVFVVDTPITYICAPGPAGTITRFQNYTIAAAQPTNPAAAPLSGGTNALVATPVTACTFNYAAGTPQRSGLVTLNITVSDTTSGDVVQLLHQVHVDNAP
jgi:MSHA biogenesis protein MshO